MTPVVDDGQRCHDVGRPGRTDRLTYTVVSDPSGGGKVLLDPATGNFSFLPDFSSVQNGDPEELQRAGG